MMEMFSALSKNEVSDTVMNMSDASCELDSIPTWLLKLGSLELVPFITDMISWLFQKDFVPKNWKFLFGNTRRRKFLVSILYINVPDCDKSAIWRPTQKVLLSL